MVSTLQLYRLLLIEMLQKATLFSSFYEDHEACKDLIDVLSQYFDETPFVAPDDLFKDYHGNLKEMLMTAEPILKSEYAYTMGFSSLVNAAHRLQESYVSAEHLMLYAKDNFYNFVLEHFKNELDKFVLMTHQITPAVSLRELVDNLTNVEKDPNESINRERKARRRFYLQTLRNVNPGDENIPNLLELETGFSIYYESIINDCLVVGNFGPV